MPHLRSHTKGQWYSEIHVNPGKAESHQRHSSAAKGCRISWVWVKQRWRFMQRQCRVQKGSHQGLVALGEQGRITLAAQFTDKDGPREVGGGASSRNDKLPLAYSTRNSSAFITTHVCRRLLHPPQSVIPIGDISILVTPPSSRYSPT